jgi:thiamine-phosphate pyrophosphorylase
MPDKSSAELPDCTPYLITPPAFDPASFSDLLAAALDAGNVNCAQVWMPKAEVDDVKRALDALVPVCHQRDVALLVCDHVDLVAASGADGVHLASRPEDAKDVSDVKASRKALGDDAIIGVSCFSSRHRALEAAEKNADYVSFGPCFQSDNTTYTDYLDPGLLSWWSAYIEVPAVAIGGITPENCGDLVKTGVDFLAVSGGVWNHPQGPASAITAFNEAITRAREEAG